MPRAKSRSFRPAVDRLEPLCLLSAGLHSPAVVHSLTVVDLKPTQVGADALIALSNSTPHSSRKSLVVNSLTADDATNIVSGRATEVYHFSFIGSLTATISFKTSIDTPRVQDVHVSVNKFGSLILRGSTKLKVQRTVVSFIQRDHAAIVSLLHPAQV
jgi:hypothetical protein